MNHAAVIEQLETWAPSHLAYDWDPIGLQVGSYTDLTKKVLVTLDVTNAVVEEAIERDVNLIIAHHPLLFKPLRQIDTQSVKGKVIQKLIQHHITVYAAHTNLDIAKGGVNDILCDALQLKNTHILIETAVEKLFKLAVYVPKDHVDQVREALGNAGAGYVGAYSHCTFQSAGTGTFKPLAGTTPFIGKEHELSYVAEQKVETIVKEKELTNVLKAMEMVHPYEEIAYDLFTLHQPGETFGLGRIGETVDDMTLEMFCRFVKNALHIKHLRFVGNPQKEIKKVAVLGGSGEKYINQALKAGADVFVTGDLNFHPAQDALEMGLALIDPGHYVEQAMKETTKTYLENKCPDLDVMASTIKTEPFQFM